MQSNKTFNFSISQKLLLKLLINHQINDSKCSFVQVKQSFLVSIFFIHSLNSYFFFRKIVILLYYQLVLYFIWWHQEKIVFEIFFLKFYGKTNGSEMKWNEWKIWCYISYYDPWKYAIKIIRAKLSLTFLWIWKYNYSKKLYKLYKFRL